MSLDAPVGFRDDAREQFWRDRVNGKWYLTDRWGDLYEIELTGTPRDPVRIVLLERNNPRAIEDYDERRTRRREVNRGCEAEGD